MKQGIVAGNWKMNGSLAFMQEWFQTYEKAPPVDGHRTLIAVPHVYLSQAQALARSLNVHIMAEDVNENKPGAYTGEISADMLKDLGVEWCLVGHSERRQYFGDTDNRVAMKALALVKAGIKPVICVGETQAERDKGETMNVILRQLNAVLSVIQPFEVGAIAYEPVWAIGTGLTASPEDAQAVHAQIRCRIHKTYGPAASQGLTILYGGSVTPETAPALFAQPDIDGALVGGASLHVEKFLAIKRAI